MNVIDALLLLLSHDGGRWPYSSRRFGGGTGMYEGYRYDTYALADSVVLVYCIFVFGCPVQKDIIMTMVPAFNEAFQALLWRSGFQFPFIKRCI